MCGSLSPGHLVDDGGEVGGSVQLDAAQALEVGLQHALDGNAVGVVCVGVLRQTERARSGLRWRAAHWRPPEGGH